LVALRLSEPNWLDALLTDAGQALLARIAIDPDADSFRLGERLRREYPAELVAAAFTQTSLRVRGAEKFTRADRMYFTREGLEQASSEAIAKHRAKRFASYETVADLCCGIGGDLTQLGQQHAVLGVDRDSLHLRIAKLNAAVYAADARLSLVCEDVRRVALDGVDAAYIDPARRAGGARLRLGSGASEPPLDWCLGLADRVVCGAVAIKAAPGLPHDLIPGGWEAEFVSEGRALKECTLWSPALASSRRRATLVDAGGSLCESASRVKIKVAMPGAFLLDPDPAVTRAGLVEDLVDQLGHDVWKIDDEVAFLSSDDDVRTPFARTLKIEVSLPWGLKRLRQVLQERRIGTVDVRKRGSAVAVDELRARLHLQGDRAATVVLTRVADKPWAFVCQSP